MHKQDFYKYPAIFKKTKEMIPAYFPDLPGCKTVGINGSQAFDNAAKIMMEYLYGLEISNQIIPEPTDPINIQLQEDEFIMMVTAWMPIYRASKESALNESVRKTVTLPRWLNELAEQEGIIFSHVLQEALKKKLGLPSNPDEPWRPLNLLIEETKQGEKENNKEYNPYKIIEQKLSE